MKIQILSDTHLEFHRDNGDSFINFLDPEGVDVLVVAGDFATMDDFQYGIYSLLDRGFPHIVLVNGNHDFYNTRNALEVWNLKQSLSTVPQLHWLENETCEIDGQRFVGTTLWFPDDPMNTFYKKQLNDFFAIPHLSRWVYETNKASQEFLRQTVRSTDVVVTHHLPTYEAVSERFRGSQLNRFFLCEMGDLIMDRQPKLWAFGHTHDSKDFAMGNTRLVCNPFGYVGSEINPDFKDKLVIEV